MAKIHVQVGEFVSKTNFPQGFISLPVFVFGRAVAGGAKLTKLRASPLCVRRATLKAYQYFLVLQQEKITLDKRSCPLKKI